MLILLTFILVILISGPALWFVSKLLSPEPPTLAQSYLIVGVVEVISLTKIPFVAGIAMFFLLIKLGGFQGMTAIFASAIYYLLRGFVFLLLLGALSNILG
jgi:hypothetical protein